MITIIASDEDIAKGLFELPLDVLLQGEASKTLSQASLCYLWLLEAGQMIVGTSVCSIAMFM